MTSLMLIQFLFWTFSSSKVLPSDLDVIVSKVKENSKIKRVLSELEDEIVPGKYRRNGFEYTVTEVLTGSVCKGVKGSAFHEGMVGIIFNNEYRTMKSQSPKIYVDSLNHKMFSLDKKVAVIDDVQIFKYEEVNPLTIITGIKLLDEDGLMQYKWDGEIKKDWGGSSIDDHSIEVDTNYSALKVYRGGIIKNEITMSLDISYTDFIFLLSYNMKGAFEYGLKIIKDKELKNIDDIVKEWKFKINQLSLSLNILGYVIGIETSFILSGGVQDIKIYLKETLTYIKRHDFSFGVDFEVTSKGFKKSNPQWEFKNSNNNNITNFFNQIVQNIQLDATPFFQIGIEVFLIIGSTNMSIKSYMRGEMPLAFSLSTTCVAPYLMGESAFKMYWITEWDSLTLFSWEILEKGKNTTEIYKSTPKSGCLYDPSSTNEGDESNILSSLPIKYVIQPEKAYKYTDVDGDPEYAVSAQFCTSEDCSEIKKSIAYTHFDPTSPVTFNSKFFIGKESSETLFLRWYVHEIDYVFDDYFYLDPFEISGNGQSIKKCKSQSDIPAVDSLCIQTRFDKVDFVSIGKEFKIKSEYTGCIIPSERNRKYIFVKHGTNSGYSVDFGATYFDNFIQNLNSQEKGHYISKYCFNLSLVSFKELTGWDSVVRLTVFEVDSQNSNPKILGYISFSVGEYQTVYNYQKGYQDKSLTFQIPSSSYIQIKYDEQFKKTYNCGTNYINPNLYGEILYDLKYYDDLYGKIKLQIKPSDVSMVVTTQFNSLMEQRGIFMPFETANGEGSSCTLQMEQGIQYGCSRFVISLSQVPSMFRNYMYLIIKTSSTIQPLCEYYEIGENLYVFKCNLNRQYFCQSQKLYFYCPFKRNEKTPETLSITLRKIFYSPDSPVDPRSMCFSSIDSVIQKYSGFLISKDFDRNLKPYLIKTDSDFKTTLYTQIDNNYRLYRSDGVSSNGIVEFARIFFEITSEDTEIRISQPQIDLYYRLYKVIYIDCPHCSKILIKSGSKSTEESMGQDGYFTFVPLENSQHIVIPYCNSSTKSFCRVFKTLTGCNNLVQYSSPSDFNEKGSIQGTIISRGVTKQLLWNKCSVEYSTKTNNWITSVKQLSSFLSVKIIIKPYDNDYYIVYGQVNQDILPLSINKLNENPIQFLKSLKYKYSQVFSDSFIYLGNGSILLKQNDFALGLQSDYPADNDIFDIPKSSMSYNYLASCNQNQYIDDGSCQTCLSGCQCNGISIVCPTEVVPPTPSRSQTQQEIIDPTPEETQPEYIDPTPEETQPENIDPTPEETQPENIDPTPEETQPENIDPTPEETQPEYIDPTPEETQPEYIDPTLEETQPEYIDPTPEETQPENINPTPEETQPENQMPTNQNGSINSNTGSNIVVFGAFGGSALIILSMILSYIFKYRKADYSSSSETSINI